MSGKIICKKMVELDGSDYLVYLKEVPVRLGSDGEGEDTTVRAFVRKAN